MNRRRTVRAIVLALLLSAPAAATLGLAAPWQPDEGDWPTLKGDVAHDGATSARSAFDLTATGLRLKWSRTDDPGYWVPPVAADLDGDGIAEVVATVGNVSADPTNLGNPVDISGGINMVDGKTGALRWKVGPTTGNLPFFSPTLADINGDGKGDIVFLNGAPLTGSSQTNKVFAYSLGGSQMWSWSDSGWGTKVPLPVSQVAVGNVDGESTHREVVALVLLANIVTSIQGGKVVVAASNPEYRVVALNGETNTPSAAWKLSFGNASASSPALGDLDGDGILDVVFGSGVKPGTWVETDSARVTFTDDFADDRLLAYKGGSGTPTQLWGPRTAGQYGGDTGSAPVLADLEGDGRPDVVETLWSRVQSPTTGDTGLVQARGHDGALRWSRVINASIIMEAAVAVPTVGDLDGDGRPEVVVQTGNGAGDAYRTIALRGTDGSVLWRATMGLVQSGSTAIGDLDGDGAPEVVGILRPGTAPELYALDGRTGALEFKLALPSSPSNGSPILADLDGDDDGRLEILLNTGAWGQSGQLFAYEPELPDLRVAGLGFNVTRHETGVPEQAQVTVSNVGSRAATNVAVDFFDGPTLVHTATITVAAGGSQVVQAPWTPASPGDRTFRVQVDRAKAVPEWVETDNQVSQVIHIGARPVCALNIAPASPDEGQQATFSDQSTDADNNVVTRAWTFGDGGSASGAQVQRAYNEGGLYQVTLNVTDADGLGCSASQGVAVAHVAPAAAFGVAPSAPTELQSVLFINQSTHPNPGDAPPAGWTWAWTFGDGSASAERSLSHAFPDGGAYAVSLAVTDNDGLGSTASRTVQVAHVAPVANFSIGAERPEIGETVPFTDLSTHPASWDGIVAWSWEFGDGGVSSARHPSHAYAARGQYEVRLTVTDDDGLTHTRTRSLSVGNLAPVAVFSHTPQEPRGGETIQFTEGSFDEDGNVTAWQWDFGDGATSTLRHPSHHYPVTGTYQVTLTVTDDLGKTGSSTTGILAVNDAPGAAFTFSPQAPQGGAPVQFTDASTDDGSVVAWHWTFGDGATSDERHPSHRWSQSGTYTVTLAVTDDFGQVGTATADIVATNAPPSASFSHTPLAPQGGEPVQFTDTSTDDMAVVAWHWAFGDGATSEERHPSHRYPLTGTYQVVLTVTDDTGQTGTATASIAATNDAPAVAFRFSPTRPVGGEAVQFTDASSDDRAVVAWHWTFGDGTTSDERHPVHRFPVTGTYTVTLTATDDAGQSSSLGIALEATNAAPAAAFAYSPEVPDGGEPVQFTDGSTDDGGIVAWAWDFGDGTTSAERHPMHRFTSSGTYEVTLVVTDATGLTGTATAVIEASNSAPVADFATNPARPQAWGNTQFLDRSIDAEGPVVAWAWDFGDGATSTLQSPSHRYTKGGIYNVTLTVTDGAGASTTLVRPLDVCGSGLFLVEGRMQLRLCGLNDR